MFFMGEDSLSAKQMVRNTGANLQHGKKSEFFQNWLLKHGLDAKSIDPYDPSFVERLRLKLALLAEYDERTRVLLEFYKSTSARGLTMMDELVNLKAQILAREKQLVEQNIDPLTDRHLQSAKHREFEIIKFLESLKYDKEKTERVIESKKPSDEDIPFIMDIDPCNTPN